MPAEGLNGGDTGEVRIGNGRIPKYCLLFSLRAGGVERARCGWDDRLAPCWVLKEQALLVVSGADHTR
ncbi:hypothetical protein GCM10009679_79120 [Saccharothrix algeriensis]